MQPYWLLRVWSLVNQCNKGAFVRRYDKPCSGIFTVHAPVKEQFPYFLIATTFRFYHSFGTTSWSCIPGGRSQKVPCSLQESHSWNHCVLHVLRFDVLDGIWWGCSNGNDNESAWRGVGHNGTTCLQFRSHIYVRVFPFFCRKPISDC